MLQDIQTLMYSCAVDYDQNYVFMFDYRTRTISLAENFNTSVIQSEINITKRHYGLSPENTRVLNYL